MPHGIFPPMENIIVLTINIRHLQTFAPDLKHSIALP
jgi:hypothetical protein